jgi:hypothetical protein
MQAIIPGRVVPITKSDATDLGSALVGIYVGGAGDVVITDLRGNDATFSAVPVGTTLWVRASKVKAATTATLLLGLYRTE